MRQIYQDLQCAKHNIVTLKDDQKELQNQLISAKAESQRLLDQTRELENGNQSLKNQNRNHQNMIVENGCVDMCEEIDCGSGRSCSRGNCTCQTGFENVENFCVDLCEGINWGIGGSCFDCNCTCQTGYANVENFFEETCSLSPCKALMKPLITKLMDALISSYTNLGTKMPKNDATFTRKKTTQLLK